MVMNVRNNIHEIAWLLPRSRLLDDAGNALLFSCARSHEVSAGEVPFHTLRENRSIHSRLGTRRKQRRIGRGLHNIIAAHNADGFIFTLRESTEECATHPQIQVLLLDRRDTWQEFVDFLEIVLASDKDDVFESSALQAFHLMCEERFP